LKKASTKVVAAFAAPQRQHKKEQAIMNSIASGVSLLLPILLKLITWIQRKRQKQAIIYYVEHGMITLSTTTTITTTLDLPIMNNNNHNHKQEKLHGSAGNTEGKVGIGDDDATTMKKEASTVSVQEEVASVEVAMVTAAAAAVSCGGVVSPAAASAVTNISTASGGVVGRVNKMVIQKRKKKQ